MLHEYSVGKVLAYYNAACANERDALLWALCIQHAPKAAQDALRRQEQHGAVGDGMPREKFKQLAELMRGGKRGRGNDAGRVDRRHTR